MVFGMDDPKMPLRTEITVLSADPSDQKPLGFRMFEREGVTIFDPDAIGTPLTELQVGQKILVPALFGGFHLMVVGKDEGNGRLVGRGDQLIALLTIAKDSRACWVCVGLCNMRGLRKLEVSP